MRRFDVFIHSLTFCICMFEVGKCAEANKCIFVNNTKNSGNEKIMSVISSLIGRNFMTQKDGYNYVVSICNDISQEHEFGTVTSSKSKDETTVLGRRNDTSLIHGDSWIVLTYGSGDFKMDKKCLVQRKASVYFVCDPEAHSDQPKLELAENDGLNYKFIFPTPKVCNFNDEISGMKIFLIILAASLSLYCLIGIMYRRFVHNARSRQQIPHLKFWSRIGNTLSDGCNYVCRCDPEPEGSWNNINSNFDTADRDDALLWP